MKPFFSWLLVIITSFHWIGGHLCFKINYSVEVEHVMNEVERKIAEAVKKEMGLDIHVETIHEDHLNVESFGYSGYFIFPIEIEGKTHYYKINSNLVEIINYEYISCQHRDTEGSTDKMIFFKRLFSKFTVQDFLSPIAGKLEELPGRNFIYTGLDDIFQSSIPTPPPE